VWSSQAKSLSTQAKFFLRDPELVITTEFSCDCYFNRCQAISKYLLLEIGNSRECDTGFHLAALMELFMCKVVWLAWGERSEDPRKFAEHTALCECCGTVRSKRNGSLRFFLHQWLSTFRGLWPPCKDSTLVTPALFLTCFHLFYSSRLIITKEPTTKVKE